MLKAGALPIQEMEAMIESDQLRGFTGQLQPASADMSIAEDAYRVRGSALPRPGQSIKELRQEITMFRHNLDQPLEPGATYLIKAGQSVKFPKAIYGHVNAKSSTGRNDIHARLVADGVSSYDTMPHGFCGDLWFMISSGHFLVQLGPGDQLSQLRLFDRDTKLDETEMQIAYQKYGFLRRSGSPVPYEEIPTTEGDGMLGLTADFSNLDVVAWRAKTLEQQEKVLVFNKRQHSPHSFFDPIEKPKNGRLVLENGRFYTFATREAVCVPPEFACEMVAVDHRRGEFRSHYAGFIDPGWGYENGKPKGAILVLEVRPFGRNEIITEGAPVCRISYERMREVPRALYGETGSHYVNQRGPRLSKHFRAA